MRGGAFFAAVVATGLACYGATQLTEATAGVGIILLACFVAIGAHIMQASEHARKLDDQLERLARRPSPPPTELATVIGVGYHFREPA
jgi:hypothetical protein